MRICSVKDCNLKHNSKGYCPKHYQRWRAHGSPLVKSKVGRPQGHKLSQESKDKMSRTKLGHGYNHSLATREKIAAGLKRYYKKKNSLSKELMTIYGDVAARWIINHQEKIDAITDVNTLSRLRSLRYTEYPASPVIEQIAINETTPEDLLIAKETAIEEERQLEELLLKLIMEGEQYECEI